MFDIAYKLGLNRPYRTQYEARARVGDTLTYDGLEYICDSFNDLGCLYWRQIANSKLYTIPGHY